VESTNYEAPRYGVFSTRPEHHLTIINKAMSVTGRGGIYVCFQRGTNIIYVWNSKVISIRGRGGPYECEILRFPRFVHSLLTDGAEAVSLTRCPRLTQEHAWFISGGGWENPSFSVRFEELHKVKKNNSSDLIWYRNREISACNTRLNQLS
jgi:hypothetical protein